MTACVRHEGQPATGTCRRCGDFTCPACEAGHPGSCDACAARPAPVPAWRTAALWVAVLAALAAAVFFAGIGTLEGAVSGVGLGQTWTLVIGLIYFAIAIGLALRKPMAFSWSQGTQGLNAILGIVALASDPPSGVGFALLGFRVSVNVAGCVATTLAKPLFDLPPKG